MRITKVYTKTGDGGKTRLAGGQEVWKDHPRVDAYGTVDELNSVVGLVRVCNGEAAQTPATERLEKELHWIQNKLFDIGGLLATAPGETFANMPTVTDEHVRHLETLMDECQKDLAPLSEFLLPGGGNTSGFLHLARTVCRRAERVCVHLSREEQLDARILRFLNRLSDACFVLARWVAKTRGERELLWERN